MYIILYVVFSVFCTVSFSYLCHFNPQWPIAPLHHCGSQYIINVNDFPDLYCHIYHTSRVYGTLLNFGKCHTAKARETGPIMCVRAAVTAFVPVLLLKSDDSLLKLLSCRDSQLTHFIPFLYKWPGGRTTGPGRCTATLPLNTLY